MIAAFESMVRTNPNRVFFTFVDAAGNECDFTYREARLIAATMASRLRGKGVRPGDCVSVDLPNCPAFVLLALAAGYGGFSLVALNNRLTAAEKLARLLDLEGGSRLRVACRVDEDRARTLLRNSLAELEGSTVRTEGRRPIMGAQRDAEESATHFAERASHLFDPESVALVMFTSGTTGKPKAVPLSWRRLIGSADASNDALSTRGRGMWQAALPLFHIGGFEVVVRSVQNRTPFRLYERFDARRVLADTALCGATHISVVDKMLQDMLAVDGDGSLLAQYRCILLGGAALNQSTVERARRVGARVFASYGMTETSSHVANSLIDDRFDGGLRLMRGYQARIVDAGPDGFGRLAVRGPGVFANYLNARAAFTVDGFFLTGDTAALRDGRLYIKERTVDMFVSGGENVYPAEIANALRKLPGISDAYVFGVPDATWGRRPVAFAELRAAGQGAKPLRNAVALGKAIRAELGKSLSKLYLPQQVFAVDELPRTGIGKIDRAEVARRYEARLDVRRVTLYRVRVPFCTPFVTAKGTLTHRDSLIVEVTDHAGRTGLGECVAFDTDWYLPETLDRDEQLIRSILGRKLLDEVYLHPREVSASFESDEAAVSLPLACGAVEPALWDLYRKIVGKPLWRLLNEEYARLGGGAASGGRAPSSAGGPPALAGSGASKAVAAGAVVGIGDAEATVAAVRRCVEAGYRRVKLKVAPGSRPIVQAVREAFPHLIITLDANQSFGGRDLDELRSYDELNVAWIEEPLDLVRTSRGAGLSPFARIAGLQRTMATPICIDESFTNAREARQALAHRELRCFAVKVAKFGGVEPALEFIRDARAHGREVWMGGMYDTGISKRLHAAFQTLPDLVMPGDVGSVSRYFDVDIADPPYTAERGMVTLNRAGHEQGLGCDLCLPALESVLVDRVVLE